MAPTERQHMPSVQSTDSLPDFLPDQTDILLLEGVFVDYIRNGGVGAGSESGRLVVEMARHAGSQYKDRFEEFYGTLVGGNGGGLTTANASAVAEDLVARCIGGGGGGCNWGRVATSLAFSRLVAGKLMAGGGGEDGDFLDAYSASVGSSISRFVREWKSREGQDLVSLQMTIIVMQ